MSLRRRLRPFVSFLLACQLFVLTAYGKPDWPRDTGVQAEAGIVVDMDSGAVLFGQNIHLPYPPASITKLLTALVVLEHCQLDETVEFSETAVNSVESDSGNKLGSVAGDRLSVEDCLYGMLLESSNQSANALAEHTAGSIPDFVEMMNEKIAQLGCTESHFDNPSGLNGDTQYVSAYDMAIIARAAFSNEELLTISSTLSRKLAGTANYPGGITVENENRLIKPDDELYYPSAKAGKTGYLIAAGNTLVTYGEENGRRLVSVILKGQPRQYFMDARPLMELGCRDFKNIAPAESEGRYVTGEEVLHLDRGDFACQDLMIDPAAVITLPNGASLEDADVTLDALPAEYSERAVGQLTYTYNDRVIGTAFLLAKDGVALPDAPQETPEEGETEPAESVPAENAASPESEGASLSAGATAAIVVLVLAVLLGGGFAAWRYIQHKKEMERLARRRAERRRRLEESGEWEEFERIRAMQKSRRAENE